MIYMMVDMDVIKNALQPRTKGKHWAFQYQLHNWNHINWPKIGRGKNINKSDGFLLSGIIREAIGGINHIFILTLSTFN